MAKGPDTILVAAMREVAKAPDDFDHMRAAIQWAMRAAVERDRKRIVSRLKRERFGDGDLASFEVRELAIAAVIEPSENVGTHENHVGTHEK